MSRLTDKPMARAAGHLASGQFARAVGAYRAVIGIDPSEHQAYLGIAEADAARGNVIQAVDALLEAAAGYVESDDHIAALALFGHALGMDPTRLEVHLDVAISESSAGHHDAAIERCEALAEMYLRAGRREEAEEIFRFAASWEPGEVSVVHSAPLRVSLQASSPIVVAAADEEELAAAEFVAPPIGTAPVQVGAAQFAPGGVIEPSHHPGTVLPSSTSTLRGDAPPPPTGTQPSNSTAPVAPTADVATPVAEPATAQVAAPTAVAAATTAKIEVTPSEADALSAQPDGPPQQHPTPSPTVRPPEPAAPVVLPPEPVVPSAEPAVPSAEPIVPSAEPVVAPAEPVVAPAAPGPVMAPPAEPVVLQAEPVVAPVQAVVEPVPPPAEPVPPPAEPVPPAAEPALLSAQPQVPPTQPEPKSDGETPSVAPDPWQQWAGDPRAEAGGTMVFRVPDGFFDRVDRTMVAPAPNFEAAPAPAPAPPPAQPDVQPPLARPIIGGTPTAPTHPQAAAPPPAPGVPQYTQPTHTTHAPVPVPTSTALAGDAPQARPPARTPPASGGALGRPAAPPAARPGKKPRQPARTGSFATVGKLAQASPSQSKPDLQRRAKHPTSRQRVASGEPKLSTQPRPATTGKPKESSLDRKSPAAAKASASRATPRGKGGAIAGGLPKLPRSSRQSALVDRLRKRAGLDKTKQAAAKTSATGPKVSGDSAPDEQTIARPAPKKAEKTATAERIARPNSSADEGPEEVTVQRRAEGPRSSVGDDQATQIFRNESDDPASTAG